MGRNKLLAIALLLMLWFFLTASLRLRLGWTAHEGVWFWTQWGVGAFFFLLAPWLWALRLRRSSKWSAAGWFLLIAWTVNLAGLGVLHRFTQDGLVGLWRTRPVAPEPVATVPATLAAPVTPEPTVSPPERKSGRMKREEREQLDGILAQGKLAPFQEFYRKNPHLLGPDQRPLQFICGHAFQPTPEMVLFLLEQKLDVNSQDAKGRTPLHYAANYSNGASGPLVQLLIDHGANVQIQDDAGLTPLHLAYRLEQCKPLLKAGARLDVLDAKGHPPAHHIMMLSLPDQVDGELVLDYFLFQKLPVNSQDSAGNSLLHYAAGVDCPGEAYDRSVSPRLIALLLARGADETLKNAAGQTPLEVCREQWERARNARSRDESYSRSRQVNRELAIYYLENADKVRARAREPWTELSRSPGGTVWSYDAGSVGQTGKSQAELQGRAVYPDGGVCLFHVFLDRREPRMEVDERDRFTPMNAPLKEWNGTVQNQYVGLLLEARPRASDYLFRVPERWMETPDYFSYSF